MDFLRISAVFSVFVLVSSTITTTLHAKSSEWITGHQLREQLVSMERRGMRPETIRCKSNTHGDFQSRRNTLFNVKYEQNPEGGRWYWAWGNYMDRYENRALRRGYQRVSLGGFTRNSGLRVNCAIWHKSSS